MALDRADGRLGRHKSDNCYGVDMLGLDRCMEHSRRIQYHCKYHDELCCDKCMFKEHRQCDSIYDIVDIVDKMNTREIDEDNAIETSIETVNMLINRGNDICSEIDQKKEEVISFFEMEKERISREMFTTNDTDRMSSLIKLKANLQRLQKVNLHLCESNEKVNKYIVRVNCRKSSNALSNLIETEYDMKHVLIWNKHLSVLLTEQLATLKQMQASLKKSKDRRLTPLFIVIFIVIFGICINAAQRNLSQ